MNPGDTVKISDLKAGDVFELYDLIANHRATYLFIEQKEDQIYLVNLKGFTYNWISRKCIDGGPEFIITYLGYLTAEMVREDVEKTNEDKEPKRKIKFRCEGCGQYTEECVCVEQR
jgi:hypothetical protein